MKLKFLGAAGTVTGSFYLLTANSGKSLIIDCGMFQGVKELDDLNYQKIDIDLSSVSGIVLTHAHLDHCGRLPILVKNGYNKAIYATPPTIDLTELSLHDTAKISKEDDKNLFGEDDVIATIEKFKPVEYEEKFNIDEFEVVLSDAGHILGAAFVEVKVDNQKIVFSGDLGNSPQDLIQPTDKVTSADIVILESTYGDRVHPKENPFDILQKNINEIEKNNAVLLIPAFSIERSQEILHKISHLKAKKLINQDTSVYFDGPMAQKATAIFEKYHEYFNREIENDYKSEINPFKFEGLVTTYNSNQSKSIYENLGAKVIIAGSGMMTGGRIVNHAAHFLPDSKNRILFVGFQGMGTLGRQIQEGDKIVNIQGEKVEINATVDNLEAMSSHADMPALVDWLANIKGVKKLIITHGEDESRKFLATKILKDLGIEDISLPNLNDEIEI